jgi:MFS family permease
MVDFFIVNVALPTIDTDLHASAAALELVVAGYGVTYALLLVLGGRLGDALGRKRLFLTGMAAFTVTSLLCGIAPTADALVGARIVQGAAAAMLVPQVLATIQTSMSGQHRARALGIMGATGGLAAVIGQLGGGLLVGADVAGWGWRTIFLVNVPIGIVGLIAAARLLPESRSPLPTHVDVPGTLLLGAALLSLLVPLVEGRTLGWPWWCWALLALAVPFGAGFVAVELRLQRAGQVPLLPPALLRIPSMRRGLILALPFFTGFGGFMFIIAVALQDGAHLGPAAAGLALVPMGLGFVVSSLVSQRLVTRLGRSVLVTGGAIQAVGLVILADTVWHDWSQLSGWVLAPGMLVAGFGQGLVMSPIFRVVLSQVPAERAGVGGGVLATTQQTCLALGVATVGSAFLTLAGHPSIGMRGGLVAALGAQIVAAFLVMVLARRLPDPRG